MRVNIYAEEMTDRVEVIGKEIDGVTYTGLRFYLELPATVDGVQHKAPFIHRPGDDDSSAVTFWGKRNLREALTKALTALDEHYGEPVKADALKELALDLLAHLTAAVSELKKHPKAVMIADYEASLVRGRNTIATLPQQGEGT